MQSKLAATLILTASWLVVSGAAAVASSPPTVSLSGTPTVYVASPAPQSANRPATWIVFRTSQHVDPRLLVATVNDRSGRSFRIEGPNCVRSTIVSDDDVKGLIVGRRYTVKVYSRASIARSSQRRLVATRSVTARSFKVESDGAHAPGCSQTTAPLSAASAMRTGVSRFFARINAKPSSYDLSCSPVSMVGETGKCRGSFVVRRGDYSVRYQLTSAAATFRNTSDSIEYRLHAKAQGSSHGLPATTGGFTGYVQR